MLGAALVIGAGVSSQYHPPVTNGNYSECSANTSNDTDDELVSYSIDQDQTIYSIITPKSAYSYSHQLTTMYSTFRTTPIYPSVTILGVNPTPS